jgi:hypothetical protein
MALEIYTKIMGVNLAMVWADLLNVKEIWSLHLFVVLAEESQKQNHALPAMNQGS